jgi:hypothetical protein
MSTVPGRMGPVTATPPLVLPHLGLCARLGLRRARCLPCRVPRQRLKSSMTSIDRRANPSAYGVTTSGSAFPAARLPVRHLTTSMAVLRAYLRQHDVSIGVAKEIVGELALCVPAGVASRDKVGLAANLEAAAGFGLTEIARCAIQWPA